jgi:hypothetical protein
MTRGDVDILRVALSKLTAGRRHEVVEALLKRLENGTIGGDELAVLRKLVDKERTVRSLIYQAARARARPGSRSAGSTDARGAESQARTRSSIRRMKRHSVGLDLSHDAV